MLASSLPTALIVFREVLEASLIVTIILAATRGVPQRGMWVTGGIVGGGIGAGLFALLMSAVASSFDGAGSELVNAVILLAATLLIGWHVIWMNRHGRQMVIDMKILGANVKEGHKNLFVLALVVGLAVMREGSEVVLMLQGLWATGAVTDMAAGGALGVGAGTLAGVILYAGFITLPVGRIFSLTNGLLMFIAAGMAARGVNFLLQAGYISWPTHTMWDSSPIIPPESILGQFLAALVGYIAQPNGVEVAVYTFTVGIIFITNLYVKKLPFKKNAPLHGATAALLILTGFLSSPATKANEVLSPLASNAGPCVIVALSA